MIKFDFLNHKVYIFAREYIGKTDKKGHKIYVGDILYNDEVGLYAGGEVIKFEGEYLVANWHCGGQPFDPGTMIKMGNVFENRELLERSPE